MYSNNTLCNETTFHLNYNRQWAALKALTSYYPISTAKSHSTSSFFCAQNYLVHGVWCKYKGYTYNLLYEYT